MYPGGAPREFVFLAIYSFVEFVGISNEIRVAIAIPIGKRIKRLPMANELFCIARIDRLKSHGRRS